MKMLMRHVDAQPVAPSLRTEQPISADVDALVLACLQKDPARRPQDAEVLFQMASACRTARRLGPGRREAVVVGAPPAAHDAHGSGPVRAGGPGGCVRQGARTCCFLNCFPRSSPSWCSL